VRAPESENDVWWGAVNQPFDAERFDALHRRMLAYLNGKDLFVQNPYAVADPRYRMPIRVITESAYHSLFARNMFINSPAGLENGPEASLLAGEQPEFTVIDIPSFRAEIEAEGTRSEVFIILNFEKKLVLIGGTSYGGEIKKSIFTVLNYLLPKQNVLSMHCSANRGRRGDVALFFGLSGTGKTTLSTDPDRVLIGDDEHGWSDDGIFNFEGGSYAKTIRISQKMEPLIYAAVHRFGSVLENVVIDPQTRQLDLDDESLTENTRAAFPLSFIPNVDTTGVGPHPDNIVFLTADAFGVLPPIAKLSAEQAMYHFLSGYTAKVAGTERGVYLSFDDGMHWQSMQRNLPITSVRDIDVHGDDVENIDAPPDLVCDLSRPSGHAHAPAKKALSGKQIRPRPPRWSFVFRILRSAEAVLSSIPNTRTPGAPRCSLGCTVPSW